MDKLVGPALGMRFRHEVRGYALEQKTKPGALGRRWHEVLLLDNGELAELIGEAQTPEGAVDVVGSWLTTDRHLSPRGGSPAHPND